MSAREDSKLKFLTSAMIQKSDPEMLKQALPSMIAKADQHLKAWNEKHGNGDAATNLAVMRLFKDEQGKGRVIGVTAGNQRLLAVNARTGAVQQLNNQEGNDDCSSKSFIGGRGIKGYKDHEIKTFDITLDFPAEEVILVALTDGAWQNFEKATQEGNPNPYLIDCEKLQAVISPEELSTSLESQTVMERLTQHVRERSAIFRKQIFQLSRDLKATASKAEELEEQLRANHEKHYEGYQPSKTVSKAQMQLNIAKDTLKARKKRKDLPHEQIKEAEKKLEDAKVTFQNLDLHDRLYYISKKIVGLEWKEGLEEMVALEQEIRQKQQPIVETDQKDLTYIQQHIRLLKEFVALTNATKTLEKDIEQQSRALDDVTITALSPFGQTNPDRPRNRLFQKKWVSLPNRR